MTTPDPHGEHVATGGIFVARGVSLTLSNLSITIGPEGIVGSDARVTLSLDVTPFWLEIAAAQARASLEQHDRVLRATAMGDSRQQGEALEAECKAAMIACAAAAIALDAFYSSAREHVSIPRDVIAAWRANRTARHKQVTEVLRQGFTMGRESTKKLGKAIGELFKWRDWAVHPPAQASAPAFHRDLKVQTEWRFVAFSAANARGCAALAIGIIAQLLTRPRPKRISLAAYCARALPNVEPVLAAWEGEFGQLYARPTPPPS